MPEYTLPPEPPAPAMAREIIGSVVPPLRPGTTDDVLLLTSEVVSNAIRHGAKEPSQEIVLRLERGEHNVRVEVVNDGPAFTPSPPFQPTEERDGGYGLYLVTISPDRGGSTARATGRRSGSMSPTPPRTTHRFTRVDGSRRVLSSVP